MDGDQGRVPKFLVSTPVLTSLAATLIIIFKYVHPRWRSVDRRLVEFAATLPGPPTLPVIGNALHLFFARAGEFYLVAWK